MHLEIREGQWEAAVEFLQSVPEFTHTPNQTQLWMRLEDVPHLILTAHIGDNLVGVKIGYERDGKFYSWLGAVDPAFRILNVGNRLADEQERWVKDHGYQHLWMKTRNCFPAMLIMALRRGFQIRQIIPFEDHLQNRIILEKVLL